MASIHYIRLLLSENMTEISSLTFVCKNPKCKNVFHTRIVMHIGGVNDYGWWIVKCEKCSEIFDIYIGRDVNDSSLTSGGEILGRYNEETASEADIRKEVKRLRDESSG